MADGKVEIETKIDDDGISRGIRNIKDKLRNLDMSLIRTAALGSAITIAPTAVPAIAALTGGVMALSSSLAAAGIGAAAFGAVAVSAISKVTASAEEIAKLEEKIANADSAKERLEAQRELAELYKNMSQAQRDALKELQSFQDFWGDFVKQFETPVFQMFAEGLRSIKTLLTGLSPTIKNVADVFVQLTAEFNQALQGSEMKEFFEWLETNAARSLYNFAHIFGNVFMGVLNLLQAFAPLGVSMEEGLLNLTDRFRDWTDTLSGSAAFQSFVEYVRANGPTLLEILGNITIIIIELGKAFAPFGSLVLETINIITGLIAQFLQANPAIAATGAAIAMFAGKIMALAPIIAKVGSALAGAVKWFLPVTNAAGETVTVLTRLQSAFAMLTSPIGLIIGAITSLTAIFVTMYQTNEEFRSKVTEIWTSIQTTISTAISAVSAFIMQIWGQIRSFWEENQSSILAATKNVWSFIQVVINGALSVIVGIFKAIWPVLKFIVVSVWDSIKGAIQGALTFIKGLIQLFSGIFTGDFRKMWEGIKNIFTGAIQAIWNIWNLMLYGRLLSLGKALFNGLKGIFQSGWNYIKSLFQGSVSSISKLVSNGFTTIKTIINFTMNQIKSIITGIWNGIKATTTSVSTGIQSVVVGVWNAIRSIISTVMNSAKAIVQVGFQTMKNVVSTISANIKSIVTKVWSDITSFLKGINLFTIGKNIMQGLLKGISSMVEAIVNKVKDVANSVLGTFKSVLDIHSPSRETEKIGKHTGEGFVKGIESKKKDAEAAARKAAAAAKKGFEQAFRNIQLRFDGNKINAKQAISELEKLKKQYATVPNAIARVNKEIYQIQQTHAKQIAEANKKAFNEAFAKVQTNFKLGKINSSQYISELRKIQKEYAKLPEQVRKVQLEIKKVEDQRAKDQAALTKKQFEDAKKAIEDKRSLNQLSLDQELRAWQTLAQKYKQGSKERIEIEKEIVRVKNELLKEQFDREKAYIEQRKYYNELSLQEELDLYETYIQKYKTGSEQREYYEREIYRVKKEIHDKLKALNDEYAQKVKETNERLYQDELKAKEEYEQKVKEINDRLIEDERKLTEEYQKAVEDRTKSLYSFAGLFDELKRENVSGQGLLKNLSDQVSAFKDWQSNIASLAEKGIDEALLEELRDMGPKAVDEIAALNSLSDEELQQYVALWREKNALAKTQAVNELEGMRQQTQVKIQELRATASAELEQVKIEYTNKIAELRVQANAQLELHKNEWLTKIQEISEGTKTELNLMSASMADIGKNTMLGLINGLNSMMGPLQQKAQEIASIVEKTVKSTLKIKSPSRVMMELGKWIPAGLAEGIGNNIKAVTAQANLMARASIPSVPKLNSSIAGAGGSGSMQTNNINKYGNVNINVTIPVKDLEEVHSVNQFFNRLGMKVRQV
ncbi:phage tail tape measure protein [Peribacillus tepidiphilus]|uniref:phage tail tape measure protein n=1 Tax=Peribacillus tepidiphilus TaxID=2652445 RepID=UPI001290A26F|nr:phage tail tape measure protein [Peribacillus tepidiphilus]